MAIFIDGRFRWQLISRDLLADVGNLVLASEACVLATAIFFLFRAPLRAFLPALLLVSEFWLMFSPAYHKLEIKSFADFTKPVAAYVKKHCAPMDFVQDGKTYVLGICNLVIAPNGEDSFDFVYDTSGDIGNYDNLDAAHKRMFAMAIRKYFNDDPNAYFEVASFVASRYYRDFFDVSFNDPGNTFGFRDFYGPPPKNSKSPYPFIYAGP